MGARAKRLRETSPRAILGLFGGNLLGIGQLTYGMDKFFMLMASDPKQAHAFLDRAVEFHLANLEKFLSSVGQYIDAIVFNDDLGMQTGPLVSLAMYREFIKPRHKLLWNRVNQLAPIKIILHSCGSIRAFLRDLIEAGVDAINPVQISAAGMDAKQLKAEFGRDLTFWGGGCDTQSVLRVHVPADRAAKRVLHLPDKKEIPFEKVGPYIQFHVAPFKIITMALVEYE